MSLSPCLRAVVPLGLLAALAACADHASPLAARGAEDGPGPQPLQALSCTADVRAGAVSCAAGTGPSGGASRLITGGQGVYVRLASSNLAYANGIFTFDATVQNLIPQTLGVGADGEPDGNGVSVVFWQEPVATEGSGDITINGALTGMFLRAGDLYYRYDETLATDQTSTPRQWSFNVPATVARFSFSVYVAASVRYPRGWVEITGAPVLQVARGASLALDAVVRNAVGSDITASAPVTWSLADPSVAAVAGSTLTGAALSGYTTLYARSGGRSGSAQVMVGTPFTTIAATGDHSCGLTPMGRAWCWGYNDYGEVGDGTSVHRLTPVPVQQGTATFVEIAPGESHTCALSTTGQTWCWGANDMGQVGDGTAEQRMAPVPVQQGGTTYTTISSGEFHTCGLSPTGQAWCWGWNAWGELGDDTQNQRDAPVAVHQGALAFVEIGAGWNHTCGLTAAGQTWCWGSNSFGQLGDGTPTRRLSPVAVLQHGIPYVEIAPGVNHSCGRTAAGQTWCWGSNKLGQLGDGVGVDRRTPVAVLQGGAVYVAITSRVGHVCGLTSAGQAWCWGANEHGQLGDGTTIRGLRPVAVSQGATRFAGISAGAGHTCARTASGQSWCWGLNYGGQLGDNSTTPRLTPVPVR